MNIHRLEIFIDLSKTFNYTETSENFFTTQGNVSKQILSLEKELSIKLFKREHRTIKLTSEGEIVLKHAKNLVAEFNLMKQDITEFEGQKNSTITMLTIPTMPNYRSFSIITSFLKQHPEINLQLKEAESDNLFTYLDDGVCDIIFARIFSSKKDDLEELSTEQDKFVAVLPINHKYSSNEKISLSDLKDDNFLILGPSTNLYQPVISLAQQAGFKPKVTYEGSRVDLVVQMVEKDMGVSILTEKTAASFKNETIKIVPLEENVDSQLSFFRKKGHHSSANDSLWKYIKSNHSLLE